MLRTGALSCSSAMLPPPPRRRPAAPRRVPLRARLAADQAPRWKGAARRQARSPRHCSCCLPDGIRTALILHGLPILILPSSFLHAGVAQLGPLLANPQPAASLPRCLRAALGSGAAGAGLPARARPIACRARLSGLCEQAARRSVRSVRPRGCLSTQWAARPQAGASPGLTWVLHGIACRLFKYGRLPAHGRWRGKSREVRRAPGVG